MRYYKNSSNWLIRFSTQKLSKTYQSKSFKKLKIKKELVNFAFKKVRNASNLLMSALHICFCLLLLVDIEVELRKKTKILENQSI